VLVILGETPGLFAHFGSEVFVTETGFDFLELGPSGFDFIPIDVALSILELFSCIFNKENVSHC
jgi:hypothetical protein